MKDTKSAEEFLEEYYLLTLDIIEEDEPVQYSLIVKAMTDFAASEKAELLEALKDIVEQAEKTKTMLPADLADSINIFGKQAIKNAE